LLKKGKIIMNDPTIKQLHDAKSAADRDKAPFQIFCINIPQADIDDLHARLASTRWPDELAGVGWAYGVPQDYLKETADYWLNGYDWRKHEARLNRFPQFTTVIDGQRVHFLHVRSPERDALPLIISHGWPGSVAELTNIIGPLADPRGHGGDPSDAFHVVAPSLPGFGFSGPTGEPGWDVWRIARAWAGLMDRLGYTRYGAQGGDWGSSISPELGRFAPDRVIGVHLNGPITPGTGEPSTEKLTKTEQARLANIQRWRMERSGYAAIQSTRPQTLAYGLADSPVGQLAWNLEWFAGYGDKAGVLDRDAILTNVSIYWFTNTAGSAARIYRESAAFWGTKPAPSGVPTGAAVFAGDPSVRRYAELGHNIVHWSEFDQGGHFAAMETPDLLVDDIRAFFRTVR